MIDVRRAVVFLLMGWIVWVSVAAVSQGIDPTPSFDAYVAAAGGNHGGVRRLRVQ